MGHHLPNKHRRICRDSSRSSVLTSIIWAVRRVVQRSSVSSRLDSTLPETSKPFYVDRRSVVYNLKTPKNRCSVRGEEAPLVVKSDGKSDSVIAPLRRVTRFVWNE